MLLGIDIGTGGMRAAGRPGRASGSFCFGRYAGWQQPENQAMLNGKLTLEQIAAKAEADAIWPEPRSGQQEQYENLITRLL